MRCFITPTGSSSDINHNVYFHDPVHPIYSSSAVSMETSQHYGDKSERVFALYSVISADIYMIEVIGNIV